MVKYNKTQYKSAKHHEKIIDTICPHCNKTFQTTKHAIYLAKRNNRNVIYCSGKCAHKSRITQVSCICKNCNVLFKVVASATRNKHKKTTNMFCTQSCAATYNNTHKKHGTRRSKLEKWIEQQLIQKYPKLENLFNKKEAINSELDIYIPSLKLAVELNGIYHYEPIHGKELLSKIQNNDNRKFQACLEREIELVIIDTSHQLYFKPTTGQKYLDIIISIIDQKLLLQKGLAPSST
jgi:hypothetical protein